MRAIMIPLVACLWMPGNILAKKGPPAPLALEVPAPPALETPPPPSEDWTFQPGPSNFAHIGHNSTARMSNGVAITEGLIRVRRRHENDMDFSKYNPFYWEGRLTHFRIEDHTSRGENRIDLHLMTEWPQDYLPHRGPDFSAIYIGNPSANTEHDRSRFAINARMNHVSNLRHFHFRLDEGWFRAFANDLRVGRPLTMEFRFFNQESFDGWQRQLWQNHHNLSAYYSEFIRIQIGQPGLLIDRFEQPNQLPSARRYAGGWTTTPTVRVEPWKSLQQQAWNLTRGNAQAFLDGRTWFHTDMVSGAHREDDSDDKPSVFFPHMQDQRRGLAGSAFNTVSCNSCHMHNGISLAPNVGGSTNTIVAKTFDQSSGNPHAALGAQLQTQGQHREGRLVLGRYEESVVQLNDGSRVTLRRPIYHVADSPHDLRGLGLSIRKPPALIGLGLLEAVPDNQIRDLARNSGGVVREVNGRVARFGWKASHVSVREQIVEALRSDMGVLSNERRNLDCPRGCSPGKGHIPGAAIEQMDKYVKLLGVPPRMYPERSDVQHGERIFHQLGCQSCHVPTLQTGSSPFPELAHQTIHPYSDLLLHDMGEGLADSSGGRYARYWRTAPLWGLKNVRQSTNSHRHTFRPGDVSVRYPDTHNLANRNPIQLLHDGRAHSIAEAILWHGGAASESVRRYRALSRGDRDALEAFLWDL